MRIYTAYVRGQGAPVLVPEGFSWGACIFGPLWLATGGAWIAAAGLLLAWVLLLAFVHGPLRGPLELLLAVATGLFGQDLRGVALEWRGYRMAQVIAGRDEEVAFARLLDARPDLAKTVT